MGYELCITNRGWQLMGDLLAAANGTSEAPLLQFSRVKFGEGVLPEGVAPETLSDLIQHVADGTSTRPIVKPKYNEDGSVEFVEVSFVVEYASGKRYDDESLISPADIERIFWLSEFSVMTFEGSSGEEIAFLRGDLIDCPMLITPLSQGALDVRQFQVSIIITKELQVSLSFVPLNWLTAQDMYDYDENVIRPWARDEIDERIDIHDKDPEAHDLRRRFKSLQDMIDKIMEMFNGQGSAPFYWDTTITIGWDVEEGVINLAENRVEY